jgi:hypothetical protein
MERVVINCASKISMLLWNSGRGAGTIQLFFAAVPSSKWKCDISCHIGNGSVMLFGGNGIPNPPARRGNRGG